MKENALIAMLLLLISAAPNAAFAQFTTVDIVTMKDGRVLMGNIIRYVPGEIIVLEQDDGNTIEITDDAEVLRIQMGMELEAAARLDSSGVWQNKMLKPKKEGVYANSMLSFAMGSSQAEGLLLGAGFEQVIGYQFNKLLGLGIGFGVDNYSRRGETVFPLVLEGRLMYPSGKKQGNFYGLAGGGYGFAFPRKSLDITEADGGPKAYLAVGYRAATAEGIDIFVDMGARLQQARFSRALFNGDVENRNVDFRRVVLRVGIGL